jgi:hypothetical protein
MKRSCLGAFVSFVTLCVLCALAEPASAQIAIDELQILNSPDVRAWPATASVTKIEFWRGAGIHIEFDKRATWPDVVPPGWDGPVQHTVWLLLKIDGRWYGSGVIECWRDRPSTDDTDVTGNNQIARNWLYDSRWGPMQGHQPQAGELVGVMVTAGDARGKDVHGVAERSRIVEIAWPAASGVAPQILWTENAESPVTSPQSPVVTPSLPPLLPSTDLSPVLDRLEALGAKVDALAQSEADFHVRVHDAWEKTGAFVLKYVAPAVAAIFAGRASK